MTTEIQDKQTEIVLEEPWLARPSNRLPFSVFLVVITLFAIKPFIVNRIIARAEAYASYGLYNNAIRECNKAIFLDNNNDAAWLTLGNSFKNQGDLETAVSVYLNAVKLNPSNKIAQFKLAMVLALQKSYNGAITHFEYIQSLGPETPQQLESDPFPYYRSSLEMLALCYERTNKPDKMKAVVDLLAKTYPNYTKKRDILQTIDRSSGSSKTP
jgi:tetratricopeptide (TPR) repeat protein